LQRELQLSWWHERSLAPAGAACEQGYISCVFVTNNSAQVSSQVSVVMI